MSQCAACSCPIFRVQLDDGTSVDVEPQFDSLGMIAARWVKPKKRGERGTWVGHHITEDHLPTHGYGRFREHAEECARVRNRRPDPTPAA